MRVFGLSVSRSNTKTDLRFVFTLINAESILQLFITAINIGPFIKLYYKVNLFCCLVLLTICLKICLFYPCLFQKLFMCLLSAFKYFLLLFSETISKVVFIQEHRVSFLCYGDKFGAALSLLAYIIVCYQCTSKTVYPWLKISEKHRLVCLMKS